MSYSQENGYVPMPIDTIMEALMTEINTQFNIDPAYTMDSFEGTNFYKYFYALAQRMQENEVKTSEIFQKLQGYITLMNLRISRPVVTAPGFIEKLESEGYIASTKKMIEADRGLIHICVDVDDGDHATGTVTVSSYANLVSGTDDSVTVAGTAFTAQAGAVTPGDPTFQAATSNAVTAASLADQINSHATVSLSVKARAIGDVVHITAIHGGVAGNALTLAYTDNDTNVGASVSGATLLGGTDNDDYADIKLEICELIAQSTVGGTVTVGTETEAIVISNGQSFDYKFNLPNRLETSLRLTVTLSENNQEVIGNPDDTKSRLLANIAEKYRLGKNFEPQTYFTTEDAPWASQVLLEWSTDGEATWSDDVYDADYDDLFECDLENVTLVEN